MKKGVIVLGGHIQGLGLVRSLGEKQIPVYLIDTRLNIAKFSNYCKKYFQINAENYEMNLIKLLNKLSDEANGWLIWPTGDDQVTILSKNKRELTEYYKIFTVDENRLNYMINKKLTASIAEELEIPSPKTYNPHNECQLQDISPKINYPAILKPAIRHKFYEKTHSQLYFIQNSDELFKYFKIALNVIDPEEILIQENIDASIEDHISVGIFSKSGTILCSCFVKKHRQIPMRGGTGTCYETISMNEEILEYCERIMKYTDYYGIAEFDFIRDKRDGLYKIIDINPRTFKWHYLSVMAGLNLPCILYNDIYNKNPIYAFNSKPEVGIKFIDEYADLYICISEIFKRHTTVRDCLSALKGKKILAVASKKDPFPFIAETVTLPYIFWNRRVI